MMLCCAESCTGGLIAKLCTDLEGSSRWFDRGFVTYSNQAKVDMLAVDSQTIKQYGAVSQQVVEEMVSGAIQNSQSQLAIAVTGIAGPTGGSLKKPIGTVWIAIHIEGKLYSKCCLFEGNRENIRQLTAEYALEWLATLIKVN